MPRSKLRLYLCNRIKVGAQLRNVLVRYFYLMLVIHLLDVIGPLLRATCSLLV